MEDEGFVDDSFIEETAWEYVGLHGDRCVKVLRQLAQAAEQSGDELSVQTWRAIAEAADIGEERVANPLPWSNAIPSKRRAGPSDLIKMADVARGLAPQICHAAR